MKDTWSLDALYTGYDDPNFTKDMQGLQLLINDLNETLKHLSHEDELKSLTEILRKQEEEKS